VRPGRWFSMSDRYFRLEDAWPTKDELKKIEGIMSAVDEVRKT